jgi:hypothetical protein
MALRHVDVLDHDLFVVDHPQDAPLLATVFPVRMTT